MRKWISDWLDFPVDLAGGVPRLEMFGPYRLRIENYGEIKKYQKNHLNIQLKKGILVISGDNLIIQSIDPEVVVIEGRIQGIRYE